MGRPKKYATPAERQAAYRQRYKLLSGVRVEHETGETIASLAESLDVSQSEVVAALLKFALANRNWRLQGLWGKRLPHANPVPRHWVVRRIPDGYREGRSTWAVVEPGGDYADRVIELGFSTKRDALAWIARNGG